MLKRRWLWGAGGVVLAAAAVLAAVQLRAPEADAFIVQPAPLVRTLQLVNQGFLSEARLDEVRRAVEVARAQVTGAQAQTRANEDSGTDVAQAQAQLAQARATTAAAQQRLAQAAVLAPTDARVLARNVEPGQIVQPGAALMSLALAGPTQLVAQVDERFLDQLQAGQKAAVVADAFAGRPFAARVLSIAPAVDAQRGAIEVKLALVGAAPAFLREDMTLSVEVETAQRERTLVVPLRALRGNATAEAGSVQVVQDGHAQARPIRLGLRTLDAVEVLDGLRAGEAVLLGADLRDGSRVRPRTVAWKPGAAAPAATREDAGSAMTNAVAR